MSSLLLSAGWIDEGNAEQADSRSNMLHTMDENATPRVTVVDQREDLCRVGDGCDADRAC